MGKIVIIGIGNAGRTVLKILNDEGLEDVEMMSFGNFPDDNREDIPHHNLITMYGHCGLGAFSNPQASKSLAEGAADQIEDIIDRAFMDDEQKITFLCDFPECKPCSCCIWAQVLLTFVPIITNYD